MRHIWAVPFAIVLGLTACGTTPRTASQGAYEVQSSFVGVLKGANAYASMPRCSAVQHAPCSEQNIVNQMASRADQAKVAVDAAVQTARDTSKSSTDIEKATIAAQNAVAALKQITPAVKG